MASGDGREQLGGDVMIHGMVASIGCLAVGNEAAEDLFVLAAWFGIDNLRVVICPTDFRRPAQDPIVAVAGRPSLRDAAIRAVELPAPLTQRHQGQVSGVTSKT